MSIKKKLKKFFTLQHRSNDGFTLVELIVVIAILAILAGVGSVGYAGYVKSANKKADMALVGDVMRAVETAAWDNSTNSGFKNITKYATLEAMPVGFVILSQDGDVQTISVDTEGTPIETSKVKTENFYYYTTSLIGRGYYDSVSVTYLLEGAQINRSDVKDYYGRQQSNVALLAGSTFTRVDSGTKTFNTENSTLLSNALEMAFGSTYASDLRLKSDEWANESGAISTRANVQETWARLMGVLESNAGILGNYIDADKFMKSAVEGLESSGQINDEGKLTVTKEQFMSKWTSTTDKNETFGITDQTVYTGLRATWNSYFADYVLQNGTCADKVTHAARINSYKDGSGLHNNVRVVTYRILTGDDSESTFKCDECAKTLQNYMANTSTNSDVYKSGSSIYDSFSMAASASQDPNFNPDTQTYADYFADYMGQMDAVYSAVENATGSLEAAGKSYIVIAVNSNYGIVECEVTPESANPRAK